MPYDLRRVNSQYEVFNKDTGKVYGKHASRDEALAQQRALYVNAPPENEVHEDADVDEMALAESVPKDAPESDFADPPSGLYVGDAEHARYAVQAVTTGYRGNVAKSKSDPGVKSRVAAAVRKFYKGKQQKYYLAWLSSGKKPEERPASETIHEMISISIPQVYTPDMPDVPLLPDINLESLRARDPNPVFVTRPIGVLNGESENGLLYDEYLLSEIERQVREKRPPARNGHVPDDAKSWMVPDSVGRWVGVLRQGDILYGKCYILPGRPFHDEVQVSDAVGGQLSNSIYGDATLSVDEDGSMKCVGLALETIDFVPPERAALQALGGDFEVTREMKGKEMAEEHNDAAADLELIKQKVKPEALYEAISDAQRHHIAEAHLRECSPMQAHEMLSDAQRGHVAEAHVKDMQPHEVYEMLSETQRGHVAECHINDTTPEDLAGKIQETKRQALAESLARGLGMKLTREEEEEEAAVHEAHVAEMKTLKTTVAEMQTTIARYEREEFNRALNAAIAFKFAHIPVRPGGDGEKKIATLKANLRPQAVAEMAGSTKIEDIEPAVTRAYESAAFKPLAEMTIQSLQGPSAFVGVQTAPGAGPNRFGYDASTGRYSEEAVQAALQRTNMVRRDGNS